MDGSGPELTRIISLNLNGIRSAAKKGCFGGWAGRRPTCCACRNSRPSTRHDAAVPQSGARRRPMHGHFHYAEKKGYSGVGLYSRVAPKKVQIGFGSAEFDAEGRYVRRFRRLLGDLGLQTLGLLGRGAPAGQVPLSRRIPAAPEETQALAPRIHHLRRLQHRAPRDRPEELEEQPEEFRLPARGTRLAHAGVRRGRLRRRAPNAVPRATGDAYTWWSNRGAAYERTSAGASTTRSPPRHRGEARGARVFKDQRFSDHAPLIIDYDL